MFNWLTLPLVALVAVAIQFGGMTFFAFMFAPLTFKFLPREQAAEFQRKLFPIYDRTNAALAVIPALCLANHEDAGVELTTMLIVALSFIVAARYLLPALERARAAGETQRFSSLHHISVILHVVQWIAVGFVLVRLYVA
jgi:hypothetical protein